jgi:CRISPR-associated protein Cas5h
MSTFGQQFVRFDVSGDLAHFRRPYAITTALTFPIPTRTALCGLIGAILGLPKDESLRYFTDDAAIFGLHLLDQVRMGYLSLNLIDTKDSPNLTNGVPSFRPKSENPHTIMRYEVIKDPRYRIWFSHAELGPRLYEALLEGNAYYTPCLGLAWMICWLDGEPLLLKGELASSPDGTNVAKSVVRSDSIVGDIEWADDGIYQRIRMPAEMQPDRTVTRYQEYIVETSGGSVNVSLKESWRLSDGTTVSPM